jgi:hypothetical protein
MKQQSGVVTTATAALKLLWGKSFFRGWRTKAAVETELARLGYHFSNPELGMALMRAPHLTRKGPKLKYQYIQKYPFVAEQVGSKKPSKAK